MNQSVRTVSVLSLLSLKRSYFVLVTILIPLLSATGQITFSGYGAAGFKFYDRDILREFNQRTYYEGKFQADIRVNKHIEAQLDFRGDSEDHRVTLREFSAKFEYADQMKIKFGNLRIPFGLEQLINRDEFYAVDNSHIHRSISDLGYGGRSVSLMAYHKHAEKDSSFPYSYYVSLFKNNSLVTGLAGRFSYHVKSMSYSINYLFQNKGGDEKINTHGFAGDVSYETKSFLSSLELFYLQDPDEGIRQRSLGQNENVFATGVKSVTVLEFKTDGDIIKKIEPLIMLGYYAPEADVTSSHTLQTLAGANFYFDKDVRLRVNADLLLTRNQYTTNYSTYDSRFTLELQVRF